MSLPRHIALTAGVACVIVLFSAAAPPCGAAAEPKLPEGMSCRIYSKEDRATVPAAESEALKKFVGYWLSIQEQKDYAFSERKGRPDPEHLLYFYAGEYKEGDKLVYRLDYYESLGVVVFTGRTPFEATAEQKVKIMAFIRFCLDADKKRKAKERE